MLILLKNMPFEIKEIEKKEIWEDFLDKIEEKTFLQSWYWGEVQKELGNKIWHLGVFEKEEIVAILLVTKVSAKRGKFLLIQHGPLFLKENLKLKILKLLVEKLKEIGKEEGYSFIRVAPYFQRNQENEKVFKNLGFKIAPIHANAYEATIKLNLSLKEEDLLKKMRKTTRYLIKKLSQNPEIKVEITDNSKDIKEYLILNRKVAKIKNFVPFSDEFIKKEFEIFSKEKKALLFFGKYKDEIVCGAIIIFWSKIAFYHQAASNEKARNLSLLYLLLWEAIKEAKKRDCQLFDFWGYVDPFKMPKHPWAGPSLFKLGFGGEIKEYLKTMDLILSPKYYLTFLIEKVRKIKRNL